jgi:hypothetical protein
VAAMTTGATTTPITNRTAICMGTNVFASRFTTWRLATLTLKQ